MPTNYEQRCDVFGLGIPADKWEEFDGTDTHGVGPATFVITTYELDQPPLRNGDITLKQGSFKVVFRRMLVDSSTYVRSAGGKVVQFTARDERWKWVGKGEIYGRYNVRQPDNEVDPLTEKTPVELVKLCFEALDVTNYDASIMESDANIIGSRPAIDWDVALPANELASLLDQFGLSLAPDRKKDKWVVVRVGEGVEIPQDQWTGEVNESLDPIEMPDALKFVGAPIRWQVRLKLESVVKEIYNRQKITNPAAGAKDNADGSWKKLEDATYIPLDADSQKTWAICDEDCQAVDATRILQPDGSYEIARDLARSTYCRTYRPQFDESGIIPTDGGSTSTHPEAFLAIDQYTEPGTDSKHTISRRQLVLTNELAEDPFIDPDGQKRQKPAFCDGVFWHKLLTGGNTQGGTRVDHVSSLDGEIPSDSVSFSANTEFPNSSKSSSAGIVSFNEQMKKFGVDGTGNADSPADLWLTCAIMILHPVTGQPIRFEKILPLPGAKPLGVGESYKNVQVIRADEVQFYYKTHYVINQTTGEVDSSERSSNSGPANIQADYYLNAKAKEYELLKGRTVHYLYLNDKIELDGAIRQKSYSVSHGGVDTKVSRNTEHDYRVPGYKEKQLQLRRSKAAMDKKDADDKANKK